MKRRGIFFSIDALIALSIILIVILIALTPKIELTKKTEVHYDILNSLSALKMKDTVGVPAELISDPELSVLEQIGYWYALNNQDNYEDLTQIMLADISANKNIGLWFGSTQVYAQGNVPYSEAKNIETARQIISGLQQGENVKGFSARAFLGSSQESEYYYFGGYIGDGNLSINIDYNGTISNALMELTINDYFDVYVNGDLVDNYPPSTDKYTPSTYDITSSSFVSGNNLIELRGNFLNIAGGFIKITYNPEIKKEPDKKYSFPGIEGAVNLYDGFYIPLNADNFNELSISLHMDLTSLNGFLNIGNVTVFNGTTNGEDTIIIDIDDTHPDLEIQSLIGKTTPLRLGLSNVSFLSNVTIFSDVASVTDLSGSMTSCGEYSQPYICTYSCWNSGITQETCEVSSPDQCAGDVCGAGCSFTWGHQLQCLNSKIDLAKQANSDFISAVLNFTGNKIGLIGYDTRATKNEFHLLSEDNTSLQNEVSSWTAGGGTCICCGIYSAINNLTDPNGGGKPSNLKSMVVMSDGEANYKCNPVQYSSSLGPQAAIDAACTAHDDFNITVHAVAFGENSDQTTMQSIADCGNGQFFNASDSSQLAEIYEVIAEIILASYKEQTVEITGLGDLHSRLYPDSFISFDYDFASTDPFGLKITSENLFSSDSSGSFSIPEDTVLTNAVVTSYSGSKWTDNVKINNADIYKLSDYGEEYVTLGDPFKISIPLDLVQPSNTVTLTTALFPGNLSGGSLSNKIIYTIVKNVSAFSSISSSASGCLWTIQFEDDTTLTNEKIPFDYSGSDECYYDEDNPSGDIPNPQDAYQNSVLALLQELDLNDNGKIDIKFTSQDLQINLNEIIGIPYTWSTEAQIRIWE